MPIRIANLLTGMSGDDGIVSTQSNSLESVANLKGGSGTGTGTVRKNSVDYALGASNESGEVFANPPVSTRNISNVTNEDEELKKLYDKAKEKYDKNKLIIVEQKDEKGNKIIEKIEEIGFNNENENDNEKNIKIFNILVEYFKNVKDDSKIKEGEKQYEYNYTDKLLIEILQKYLDFIILLMKKNKTTPSKNFDLLKNMQHDIEEYLVNIDIIRTNIRKQRSTSHSVLKIAQYSEDDLFIGDKIVDTYNESFQDKYKKDLEISKNTSFEKEYPQESLFIKQTIDKIQKLQKIGNIKKNRGNTKTSEDIEEKIKLLISELTEKYKGIFNLLNLPYISQSIYHNNSFSIDDYDENKYKTSIQQHKLSYLELLHKTYLSDDHKFFDLNNEKANDNSETKFFLLGKIIESVTYKGNTQDRHKDDKILLITKIAYEDLTNIYTNSLKRFRTNKEKEDARKLKLKEEAARLLKEQEAAKKAQEEASARLLQETPKPSPEEQTKTSPLEQPEPEETNKAEKELCNKIKEILEAYSKKTDKTNIDNRLASIKLKKPNQAYDYLLQLLKKLNTEFYSNNKDFDLEKCLGKENNDLRQVAKENLQKLLEIILGAARVFVNIRNDENMQGGSVENMQGGAVSFLANKTPSSKSNTVKLNTSLCNNNTKEYGPFDIIFPEVKNKNVYIYNKLFGEKEKEETDDENIDEKLNQTDSEMKKYNYEDIKPQDLMTQLNNGESVVLFGFGFSGSGKTYTLIKGKIPDDKSLLQQFIEKHNNRIKSIDFVEIYPESNSIYIGDDQYKSNTNDYSTKVIFKHMSELLKIKHDEKYNSITKDFNNYENVKTHIDEIEKHRIKNMRILPTPNNPTSSRSFFQITIQLNNSDETEEGDKGLKSGKLVLFDMPGTENTVEIKKIMLGKEIFTELNKRQYNGENFKVVKNIEDTIDKQSNLESNLVNNSKSGLMTQKRKKKIISNESNKLNKLNSICEIIFYEPYYYNNGILKKNEPDKCKDRQNIYYGLEEKLADKLGNNFIITYENFYKDYKFNIKQVQFISKYDSININAYNIVFKYFLLNIKNFNYIGIDFKTDKIYNIGRKNETDKSNINKIIANLTTEFALFFSGKVDTTIEGFLKEYKNPITIKFLNDNDFKKIYDNFIIDYIKKNINNFDNYKTNLSLEGLSNEEIKQQNKNIYKIFNIDNQNEYTNTIYLHSNNGINFSYNKKSQFYNQTFDKTEPISTQNDSKTVSPLIKYILLILQYLYDNIVKNIEKEKENNKDIEDMPSEFLNTTITDTEIKAEFIKIYDLYNKLYNSEKTKYQSTNKVKKPEVSDEMHQQSAFELLKKEKDYKQFLIRKKIYERQNIFYRASVYFIYKYIQFIVKQGDAIVTTLEHLKFFFLTKAGQIVNYNEKCLKEKITPFTIDENLLIKDNNIYKFNSKKTENNIFNGNMIYEIVPKESDTDIVSINEKINIGNMDKYGLIQILQYLAGNETDIFNLNIKSFVAKDGKIYYYPDFTTESAILKKQKITNTNTNKINLQSIFIMFAHILTNTTGKDCNSVINTLEYIDSISNIHKEENIENIEELSVAQQDYVPVGQGNLEQTFYEVPNENVVTTKINNTYVEPIPTPQENYVELNVNPSNLETNLRTKSVRFAPNTTTGGGFFNNQNNKKNIKNHNNKRYISLKNINHVNKNSLFTSKTKKNK